MKTRSQYIQLIHVAKNELRMEDDVYRAMLAGLELPNSTTKMDVPQLHKVLEHLKRSGFKVRSKAKSRPQANDDQSKMIRGLWLELHDHGYVSDASEAALAAWIKRETGIEALQWLNVVQAQTTIEKLKQWRRRDEKRLDSIIKALHVEGRLPVNSTTKLALEWFSTDKITKSIAAQIFSRLTELREVNHE